MCQPSRSHRLDRRLDPETAPSPLGGVSGGGTGRRLDRASRGGGTYPGLERPGGVVMALLRYGSELRNLLDVATTRQVMEAVGAHASRGGWVNATDTDGRGGSVLVSAGVPIWINEQD